MTLVVFAPDLMIEGGETVGRWRFKHLYVGEHSLLNGPESHKIFIGGLIRWLEKEDVVRGEKSSPFRSFFEL